ncbi:MAG: TonB-dependent receptor [Pseudomonadota bacterium]
MTGKFERNLLSSMISLSLAGFVALPVQAQETIGADEELEEVVVTGIRSAIRNSIEEKRRETSIIEAVSAEDIGKLPDVSIAESIARLPGLAAQRTRGRAQVISVRGLGPDFTTALLNGREQVTAGDNRGVEFDQYPAEILSQAVIYKTPESSLIGQAVGGTVDLRTIRPLSYGRKAVSIHARYEQNDQGSLNSGSDDDGYRLTASYIDQFANDTIGIAIAAATQTVPNQAERWDAWGYPSDPGALVIGGAKPFVESRDLERDAIIGTLEYAPTDTFSLTADVFYSDFQDGGILRGIEFPLQWSGASLRDGFNVEDGLVTSGVFDNTQGVLRNDLRSREAELTSFGLNMNWQANDNWTIEADLSTSEADRDDIDLETYSGTGSGFGNGVSDSLGFAIADGGRFVFDSQLDYSDPNLLLLTDPQGWGQVGFVKQPATNDELTQLRLSAERYVGGNFFDSIEFGVAGTSRDKDKTSIEGFLDLANGGADNTAAIPSQFILSPTELDFLGIPGVVSYDPRALLNAGLYSVRTLENADVLAKRWDVSEDIRNAYVQFNVATQWGDMPIRGNFGLQYVDSEQDSTGPQVNSDGSVVDFSDGVSYSDLLPSMNLTFELTEQTYVRLSASKTIQRPRMDDFRAGRNVSFNSQVCGFDENGNPALGGTVHNPERGQSCINLDGGNPRLRPYEANAVDVSLEHYFANTASNVALALFYKDIDTWVFNGQRLQDVTNEVTAIFGPDFANANPELSTGVLSAPINTEGGRIRGAEFSTNLTGDLINPALENWGVYLSFAYNSSEITPEEGGSPISIPGFSRDITNAAVYYESNRFQARVSMRDRSDFLGEVTGFGANRDFRDVRGENVIDAQIGWTFTEGFLAGSTLIFQAYNLTDEEFVTFLNDDPRQVKDWQRYGTSYALGFNYKF